jgi:hypothetical protein
MGELKIRELRRKAEQALGASLLANAEMRPRANV